jgi:hypothetical protein
LTGAFALGFRPDGKVRLFASPEGKLLQEFVPVPLLGSGAASK